MKTPKKKRYEKSYFMSKKKMIEAKVIELHLKSQMKRGEIKSYHLYQCGCGCGVSWYTR